MDPRIFSLARMTLVLACFFAAAPALKASAPSSLERGAALTEDLGLTRPALPAAPIPPSLPGPTPPNGDPVFETGEAVPVEVPRSTRLLAKADLALQFDRHLKIAEVLWDFNGHPFHASVAIDRQRQYYFAFTPPSAGETLLAPGDNIVERPVVVQLAPGTRYRISLAINPLDPMASKVTMSPERGFQGKTHRIEAKRLQELVRKNSVGFTLPDAPYHLLYGRDADKGTLRLAQTRSFCFAKDKGTDSKATIVFEEQVPLGQWVEIAVGPNKLLLLRPAPEVLEIHTR